MWPGTCSRCPGEPNPTPGGGSSGGGTGACKVRCTWDSGVKPLNLAPSHIGSYLDSTNRSPTNHPLAVTVSSWTLPGVSSPNCPGDFNTNSPFSLPRRPCTRSSNSHPRNLHVVPPHQLKTHPHVLPAALMQATKEGIPPIS